MINKKYLKNLRCKELNNENEFIFDLISERIVDSLDIINIEFKKILIFGDAGSNINKYILKRYKDSSVTIYDFKRKNNRILDSKFSIKVLDDLDLWSEIPKKYDLILSNLFLSFSNNLEMIFKKIIVSLIPNGLFLATLPNVNNFQLLRKAMIDTDLQLYGGAYNRFNKTSDLHRIIDYLKINNFKIPLVDIENVRLEYVKFNNLINDVKSMNLSYYHEDKKTKFEKKIYFQLLEKNYKKNLNKNFELITNFFIISGWKDHPSQQKPIKPGEAKHDLKDFIK